MTTFVYRRGAELPSITLPWKTETAPKVYTNLDLSDGYTFALTLDGPGDAITPSAVVTGGDGFVTIAWAVDDLDITPGLYLVGLRANETITGKDRDYEPTEAVYVRVIP